MSAPSSSAPSDQASPPVTARDGLDLARIRSAVLDDFIALAATGLDRERLLEAGLQSALSLPELDGGGLYWREADGAYRLAVRQGLSERFFARVAHLAADSPQAEVIRRGRLELSCRPIGDHCTDELLVQEPALVEEGAVALVVLPVHVGDAPLACLSLVSKQPGAVGAATVAVLHALVHELGSALERALARVEASGQRENLAGLFQAIADYVVVLDPEQRVVHYNPAVAAELGYGERLLGQPVWVLHPADAREEAGRLFAEMLAGTRVSCPLPLLKASGQRVLADTRVVRGQWDGRPALIVVSRDMTEQVRQQDALREERRFSSELINLMPGIFYLFDELGRLVRWSNVAQITGYSEEQIAGMSAVAFFVEEDRARVQEAIRQALETGEGFVEARLLLADGGQVPYRMTGRRLIIGGKPHLIGVGFDISAQQATQRTLEGVRTHLKTLISTIPDLVWLKDPDGVYLNCNPAFERLYGASESEILGKTDYAFVPAELADFFRANDRAAAEAGRPCVNVETLEFAADGYRGLFETVKTPMRAEDGHIVGVLGIARDITAARAAEEALREREEIYSLIFNQALDGIELTDAETLRFVEVNDAACRLLGYSRDELLQMTLDEIQGDGDSARLRERAAEVLASGGQIRFQNRHRRKDGGLIDVGVSVQAVRLRGKDYFVGVWRDIGSEKASQMALANEAEWRRALIENSADGVAIFDESHQVIEMNARFAERLGYQPHEALGLRAWDIDATLQESEIRAGFADPLQINLTFETRHRRKDGSIYDAEVSVRGAHIGGRNVFITITRDVSDRKAQQRALQEREEIYSAIINQATDGIVLIDTETLRFSEFNDAACRGLGYTREELGALTIASIQGVWDPERVAAQMRTLIAQGGGVIEVTHRTKDGELRQVRAANRLLEIRGRHYFAAIWYDITEQRRAERTQHETMLFLRESQAIARVGGWKANPETGSLMWTEEVYHLIGRPLSGEPVTLDEGLGYYAPDCLPLVREKLQKAWEQGTPFTIECEMIPTARQRFWAELRCVGRIDGEEESYLAGTFQDISERKAAEAALRSSTEFLKALLEAMPAPIFYKDASGRYLGCNHAFETFFGRPREDIVGKTVFELSPCELAEVYHSKDCELFERSGFQVYESQITDFRGKIHDVVFHKASFPDSEGGVGGLIGVFLDITESRRVTAELESYRHHLEELVAGRTADLEAANRQLMMSDLRLKAMFEMSQQADTMDERALLQRGIDEAVRLTGSEIGYLHFVNDDQESIQLYTWSTGTLSQCTAVHESHYPISAAGVWADAARRRRPVVHNDYQSLSERRGYPGGHAHLIRHLGVPVVEGDQVRALIGVGRA